MTSLNIPRFYMKPSANDPNAWSVFDATRRNGIKGPYCHRSLVSKAEAEALVAKLNNSAKVA